MRHLYRSRRNKNIAGVCGGLGEYLEADATVIRIIAILAAVFSGGIAVLAYLVCIVVIPLRPGEEESAQGRYARGSGAPGYETYHGGQAQPARMEGHIKILGILYIVSGSLKLLAGAIVLMVLAAGGVISGDPTAMRITTLVGSLVGGFLLLLALPEFIGGAGIMKKRSWARVVLMVLGVLNLLAFPFGTALGLYTLWVLASKESEPLFQAPEA